MLKNFQLVAIIKEKNELRLQRFSLNGSLQNTLADEWAKQYKTFIKQKEEKDFTIAYTLGTGELFKICSYKLPPWLAGEDSESIRTIEEFHINERLANSIRGVASFARDDENNELMLFQNFAPSQVIRPGGLMTMIRLGGRHTYSGLKDSALRLNNKLVAVYSPKSETLLFNRFLYVNKFLPLSDAYYTASRQDILNLLSHPLFECEDKGMIVTNATQFIRRRFAILKDSKILDRLSTTAVKERATKYNLEIQVQNDRIVFPTDNDSAKVLLRFLNQEIFQGPLTDELFETNSKKKVNV